MKTKVLVLAACLLAVGTRAQAIPILQTYVDDATYDSITQTWVSTSSSLTIWVVGNVGARGPIVDVHIAAAYYWGEVGSLNLSALGDAAAPVWDPYKPDGSTVIADVDGARPVMQSGDDLPSHGVYGAGRAFKQWYLGDFTSTDDAIQDYTDVPTGSGWGQINKYTVDITGYTSVHFDVYNHVENRIRSSFNPFSHDGEVDIPEVPEPTSLATITIALGLAGASGLRGIRRRKRA